MIFPYNSLYNTLLLLQDDEDEEDEDEFIPRDANGRPLTRAQRKLLLKKKEKEERTFAKNVKMERQQADVAAKESVDLMIYRRLTDTGFK